MKTIMYDMEWNQACGQPLVSNSTVIRMKIWLNAWFRYCCPWFSYFPRFPHFPCFPLVPQKVDNLIWGK